MVKRKKIAFICIFILLMVFFAKLLPVKPLIIKNNIIFAEIARTPQQRAQGLQFRDDLAPDRGMLFCFEKEGFPSFWMLNTKIPLDIAFLDSRARIVDIQTMEPLDPVPRYAPKKKAKYALEVNSGYFQAKNISVGDRFFFW